MTEPGSPGLGVTVAIIAALVSNATTTAADPAPAASREPTVAEVVAAAVRFAGLEPGAGRRLARRARLSAVMPWLSIRAARNTDWETEPGSPIDRSLTYEARATWRLDRLVFDSSEIRTHGVELQTQRLRIALAERVSKLYFKRHRLRLALAAAADDASAVDKALDVAEVTAELDALTGGFVSARADARARPTHVADDG